MSENESRNELWIDRLFCHDMKNRINEHAIKEK